MAKIEIGEVKMKDGATKLKVESPFHPEFPKHARNLGGRWDSSARAWYFDPRDEDSVRDLCLDCFGDDGRGAEFETVDVQVWIRGSSEQSFWFAGREIAKRPGRDWTVKLGEGVVLVEGEFKSRGGSAKYPCVFAHGESALLEVRDVPLVLALREQDENPDDVTILGDVVEPPEAVTVEVDTATVEALRIALLDLADADDGAIIAAALEAFLS